MSFLTPKIESELTAAVAECERSKLLVAYDPETSTCATVWVDVHPGQAPVMTRWAMSGPISEEGVEAFAAEAAAAMAANQKGGGDAPGGLN